MEGHIDIIVAGIDHVGMTYCIGSFQHIIQPWYKPEKTYDNKSYRENPFSNNPVILQVAPLGQLRVQKPC